MTAKREVMWSIYARNCNHNNKIQSPKHSKPQIILDNKNQRLDEYANTTTDAKL